MPPVRYREYRDDQNSTNGALLFTAGAVAGLAAGVLITQRFGGFNGLLKLVRSRLSSGSDEAAEAIESERRASHGDAFLADDEFSDEVDDEEDELLGNSPEEELEERVLEAFHEDAVLASRAIDIGAIGEGVIELTGWVRASDEAGRALMVARQVPGVERVVNHIVVRGDTNARKSSGYAEPSARPEATEIDTAESSNRAD